MAVGAFAALSLAGASYSAAPRVLLTYGISYGPLGSSVGGLCLSNPDGSHAVRITGRRDDREPAWSLGGRYLAFSRQTNARERRRGASVFEIYISTARGRIVRNISKGWGVFNNEPAWSPDGRWLAFTGGWRGSAVSVVGRKGGRPQLLVSDAAAPDWSPDGTRLAFSSEQGISTIRPDGTDRKLIVSKAFDSDFSPDGTKLAFVRRTDEWGTEIFVANADGTGQRRLTSSYEAESGPAWSPDGSLVAFTRWDRSAYTNLYWIVVVRGDSGEEYAVIRGPHSAFDPAWRPAVNLPRAKRGPCR